VHLKAWKGQEGYPSLTQSTGFLFFKSLSDVSRSPPPCNHQEEQLAKFGYRSERKVKKIQILLCFCGVLESFWSKFGDFTKFSYKLGHFLPKESFEDVMMDFFFIMKK